MKICSYCGKNKRKEAPKTEKAPEIPAQ